MPSAPDTVQAWRELLAGGRWFAAIDDALREALLARAHVCWLAPGELLFARGDPPDGLYAVLAGGLCAEGVTTGGKHAVATHLEPPQWFGEIGLVDGGVRTHDARATEATALLHVPQAALLALLRDEPRHWHAFARLLADRLRLALVALEDLALMPAPQRIARRLLLIAAGYGGADTPRAQLRLSQDELASMVAVSRQTANQVLRELAAAGALRLQRGGVEIVDAARLRAAATSSPEPAAGRSTTAASR